jgi:hypothetical protein
MDARGALTAVGLNQNVVVAERLPVPVQGVVLAQLSSEEGDHTEVRVQVELKDPEGNALFAQSALGRFEHPPSTWQLRH